VNRDEAKAILLLYRHGTTDAEDPQIAEVLALARRDEVLANWLEMHCAKQVVLSEKLRQITVPAGLKEQIISEHAASQRIIPLWRRQTSLIPVAAIILLSCVLASVWLSNRGQDVALTVYQNEMVGIALRGYGMDLTTNDPVPIRAYLAQNHAPSDFILPEKLKQAALAGCAIEGWQDAKVTMICFRTRQAASDVASDVWLFVVDRAAVKRLPETSVPQIAKVNRLITATWVEGDKLYFLGTLGDEQTIKQYL
jgi:hypothetical protein